jgi:hypothetical protein
MAKKRWPKTLLALRVDDDFIGVSEISEEYADEPIGVYELIAVGKLSGGEAGRSEAGEEEGGGLRIVPPQSHGPGNAVGARGAPSEGDGRWNELR